MRRESLGFKLLKQAICLILCLIILAPIWMVVVNSFQDKAGAARMGLGLPRVWHPENYIFVYRQARLGTGLLNSTIYATSATVAGVLAASMAASILGRRKSRVSRLLYYFILTGLFLPMTFVTLLRLLQGMGIYDTRVGIVLAFTGGMIPFCVFIIRNFISTIPVSMDEAAVIDGAGPITLFLRITLPLLKPILITAGVLQFMGVWNDFMTPLYLAGSSRLWPVNLSIYNFFGKESSNWHYVCADIVITSLPVVLVYFAAQRYIIGGMTAGAVKG